jgi:hypothetical protein
MGFCLEGELALQGVGIKGNSIWEEFGHGELDFSCHAGY